MIELLLLLTLTGQVYNVVDGDTIDVVVEPLPDLRIIQRVRIHGVDTPEKRTRRKCEKKLGIKATEFLEDLFDQNNMVILSDIKGGKYAGRIIAKVLVGYDENNLADIIIAAGHGIPYFGGKRGLWPCE